MTKKQRENIRKLKEELNNFKEQKNYFLKRVNIFERDNSKCRLCGEVEQLQIHHITPREVGGTNESYNLMLVCLSCHLFLHCNPKMVMNSKRGMSSSIKNGLLIRKQNNLPIGRQKGAKDKSPRRKQGYFSRWAKKHPPLFWTTES